jgi:hypothetical protein
MTGPFLINSPPITHQTIDGEVVIINLNNGSYYSLRHTGATLWALVENGSDLRQIVQFFSDNYDIGPEMDDTGLLDSVTGFLNALCDEQLIHSSPDSARGAGEQDSLPPAVQVPANAIFSLPKFDKYDDLQDLVMLDPIHQVSEEGWPHAKEDD